MMRIGCGLWLERWLAVVGVALALGGPAVWAAEQGAVRSELKLVSTVGPGAIPLPRTEEWKPEMLTVYDEGKRPAAQFQYEPGKMGVSFLLFKNGSGAPDAKSCREAAIGPMMKNAGKKITERQDGEAKLADGTEVATTSYLLTVAPDQGSNGRQRSLFAFAGNATTCAEMHVSSVVDTPAQRTAMRSRLKDFRPDLTYKPAALDLFLMGQLLFKASPKMAVPYFRASLEKMPAGDANFVNPRRLATDQLVMALGVSGDVKGSRAVAEKAAAADPEYPLNYYNLACADAEEGDAASAKKHLQEAFDRKKNLIEGEKMPDPTIDDSIKKLQGDKDFWAFVQGLPKE
ncbi:hypothetical protein DYQ86_19660 [Acidobacteria bacterium AB60]|nr:hypothetical protein DYQ86_19660 [Acidobacteria bacterium AB60]